MSQNFKRLEFIKKTSSPKTAKSIECIKYNSLCSPIPVKSPGNATLADTTVRKSAVN